MALGKREQFLGPFTIHWRNIRGPPFTLIRHENVDFSKTLLTPEIFENAGFAS